MASYGEDPAVPCASGGRARRRNGVYGYDALAWALLANRRADEARA